MSCKYSGSVGDRASLWEIVRGRSLIDFTNMLISKHRNPRIGVPSERVLSSDRARAEGAVPSPQLGPRTGNRTRLGSSAEPCATRRCIGFPA